MRLKEEYRKETIIQKSRFIACVMPVFSEDEARLYIEKIRKEHAEATHVCTAYMTGENQMIQRSNDNHEPSGTAGIPMLESIRRSGLENVCACVVRYFGGIKLGAGGLIRAYSSAVSEALAEAPKLEKQLVTIWKVTYPYTLSGSLEGWLRYHTNIIHFEYDEYVHCTFESQTKNIPEQIRDISKGQCKAIRLEDTYHEIDV